MAARDLDLERRGILWRETWQTLVLRLRPERPENSEPLQAAETAADASTDDAEPGDGEPGAHDAA